MEPRLQLILGFHMMSAAINGGHNLKAAWDEILETSTGGAQKLPHVWGGALGSLVRLADALQERGILDADAVEAPTNAILKATASERLAMVFAATQANDIQKTFEFAYVLMAAVEPHRNELSFSGKFTR